MAFKETVLFSAIVALLAVTGNGPTGAEACTMMDVMYDSLKVAMYNMSEDMIRIKGDWQMYMDMYTMFMDGHMDLPSVMRAMQNMQNTQNDLMNHMINYNNQASNMQTSMFNSMSSTYVMM